MNTGGVRLDRRIEEGASSSAVSSEELAHEVHGDDQEAMDCPPSLEERGNGGQNTTQSR